MKNRCGSEKKVSAYADGLLSLKKTELMESHIAECEVCRKELEALRLTEKILKEIPEITPSTDFSRTFWQKVDAIEASEAKVSVWKQLSPGWRPCLAVSAAFSILLLTVALYRPFLTQPGAEDIIIAENIEFFEVYPLVDNLELLENWDIIEHLEDKS